MSRRDPLFTVTVEEQVTAYQIDCLLDAAFEGGSNYWISRPVRPVNNDYRGAEFDSGEVRAVLWQMSRLGAMFVLICRPTL